MTTVQVYQQHQPIKMTTNILQQSSINNNNNNSQNLVLIASKAHQNQIITKDDILLTNTAKKKPFAKKEILNQTKPAPIAVARRNARERNRVKQVNNGFANLRQHIPNSIAAAFETNNGRGGNKKLSKVETLRMAVEYIRRLEDILASSSSSQNDEELIEFAHNQKLDNYADLLSSTQRFVKVIGSGNDVQLVPMIYSDNTENVEPLDLDSTLLSSNLDNLHNINLLNSMSSASLSPEMYSDNSMSPNSMEKSYPSYQDVVFDSTPMKFRIIPPGQGLEGVKLEPVDLPGSVDDVMEIQGYPEDVMTQVKLEKVDDSVKNNVMDVINWWQQPSSNASEHTSS